MDDQSYQELQNGEIVGVLPIEITSIPDVSILNVDVADTKDSVSQSITIQKKDFATLLSELFQRYRIGLAETGSHDVSFEIFWKTQKVENQAYAASIKLYVVLRTIGVSKVAIDTVLSDYYHIFSSALELQRYEFRKVQVSEISNAVRDVRCDSMRALVKDEAVVSLQNQMLNECYSFDRIPQSEQDLSRIVNVLIDHPDCGVFLQLIPTSYTLQEIDGIDRMTTVLKTLNKGLHDKVMGNIGFALAEKHAETYKYYSEHKASSLFSFNILVVGGKDAVNSISSRVYGQINSVPGREAALKFVSLSQEQISISDAFYSLPWVLQEIVANTERSPLWQIENNPYANFKRLPYIITGEEASEFFRLPIGSSRVAAGLKVNTSDKASKTYSSNIINGGDITVGKLRSSSGADAIGFFLKDLTKHMLVVGTPGSGKTTFSVSLLNRLWKDHKIPFLVIEPAKNEYRALVQSIPDLQVFTPGKNFISPFVFNPFVPPENVTLESYKSVLKTAFAAAVTMSTPLDKIFEETIDNCYSEFRWLDNYTTADKGRVFNIQDFVRCFKRTFESIGYTGDAKNIGRAGMVRLQSLVRLFDNYSSIPIKDLLAKPTVIELAAIENAEQKSLIIALLLLSILSYVNRNFLGEGKLRNVILLEEAHVLLDSDGKAGEGAADPSAIAKGLVKRMLAEIRSYGVGLVIADQSPRKVGTDVVALTNIKLAFRLVEREDKEILSDSTNMTENQKDRLARLKPGEAMLFFDKLEEPEEVVTEDYRAANNISISLTDEGIRDASTYWNDKLERLKPYPECACVAACSAKCDFMRRNLAREIAKRIFKRHFNEGSSDFEVLKSIYSRIGRLVPQELNDEPMSKELVHCVRMHFLRNVKFGTKIKLDDATIHKTLKALKK